MPHQTVKVKEHGQEATYEGCSTLLFRIPTPSWPTSETAKHWTKKKGRPNRSAPRQEAGPFCANAGEAGCRPDPQIGCLLLLLFRLLGFFLLIAAFCHVFPPSPTIAKSKSGYFNSTTILPYAGNDTELKSTVLSCAVPPLAASILAVLADA